MELFYAIVAVPAKVQNLQPHGVTTNSMRLKWDIDPNSKQDDFKVRSILYNHVKAYIVSYH